MACLDGKSCFWSIYSKPIQEKKFAHQNHIPTLLKYQKEVSPILQKDADKARSRQPSLATELLCGFFFSLPGTRMLKIRSLEPMCTSKPLPCVKQVWISVLSSPCPSRPFLSPGSKILIVRLPPSPPRILIRALQCSIHAIPSCQRMSSWSGRVIGCTGRSAGLSPTCMPSGHSTLSMPILPIRAVTLLIESVMDGSQK